MNCSDCRFWEPPKDYDPVCNPEDPDTFEPIPTEMLGFEVRRCRSPKLITFERPQESDWASVCDGSDYHAVLYTGPNFGCVNGQPLEPTSPEEERR